MNLESLLDRSTSMRVLHCAETIKGGIATYLRELIPLQREALGVDAVVAVIPESHKDELLVPDGVRVVLFDDSGSRVRNALMLAVAVAREMRASRLRVVHVHSTFAGVTVRPLLALLGRDIQVVYCPHGWAFDRCMPAIGKAMVRLVERMLLTMTDAVICISDHERRVAIANGLRSEKLQVVLNGVTRQRPVKAAKAPEWPAGRKRLLFVGRFDHQKGVDVMAAAMTSLANEAHAVFVGGSVLDDGGELSFPDCVTRAGWLTPQELETFFCSADVLVVPSRWEGFGLIAAEAMRAGLAVIASRVGGLPEVVKDGVTGVLVEPESPEAIVLAVRSLDRATLRRMGQAGRQRFLDLFSMERVSRQLWAVYGFKDAEPYVLEPLPSADSVMT